MGADIASTRIKRMLWLLPGAFVVHDAEEFVTMPTWFAANGQSLHAMLQQFIGASGAQVPEPQDALGIGLAMLVILSLFAAAAACASLMPKSRTALVVYMTLLGAFFLHGLGHVGQAILFRGYTPGVVTAILVVIPVSLCVYGGLRRSARASKKLIIGTACTGAVLVVPGILLALWIGQQATR